MEAAASRLAFVQRHSTPDFRGKFGGEPVALAEDLQHATNVKVTTLLIGVGTGYLFVC